MIVEKYGICPNCEIQLEWKEDEVDIPSKPEQNAMRKGNIKCDCGQEFYYETKRLVINCIKCGKEHSVV